jgi:hypothetical protein
MGNSQTVIKVNFEDMKDFINNPNIHIINTMPDTMQKCLISGTIPASEEMTILNNCLTNVSSSKIIIYGMNSSDDTIVKKYNQLISLGFTNVYIYSGGMFEWLLLQDIFGNDEFPTTSREIDLLKYKGNKISNRLMITDL